MIHRSISVRVSIAIVALASLGSCSVNDPASTPLATVQGNFFPLDDGIVYTYGRTANSTSYDTIACVLITGGPYQQNQLQDIATGKAFYYFTYTKDADGNDAAILSTDTSSLMVLDGSLQDSATWIADDAHGIRATVIAQYDDYYLPGRQEDFTNVLEVEYHQDGQPTDTYTLRFFAEDHGLILEREIVGPSEIARLQLIGLQYPS